MGDFYDYGSSDDQLKLIYGYADSGVTGRLTDFDLKAGSAYLLQDGYGYDAVTGRLNPGNRPTAKPLPSPTWPIRI